MTSVLVPARRGPALPLGTGEGAPSGNRRREEAGADVTASQQPGQHLLLGVGEGLLGVVQVLLPGARVPDLYPGVRPDDDAVLGQPRVLAQLLRHRDAALAV